MSINTMALIEIYVEVSSKNSFDVNILILYSLTFIYVPFPMFRFQVTSHQLQHIAHSLLLVYLLLFFDLQLRSSQNSLGIKDNEYLSIFWHDANFHCFVVFYEFVVLYDPLSYFQVYISDNKQYLIPTLQNLLFIECVFIGDWERVKSSFAFFYHCLLLSVPLLSHEVALFVKRNIVGIWLSQKHVWDFGLFMNRRPNMIDLYSMLCISVWNKLLSNISWKTLLRMVGGGRKRAALGKVR